jgi:hypothetical protein
MFSLQYIEYFLIQWLLAGRYENSTNCALRCDSSPTKQQLLTPRCSNQWISNALLAVQCEWLCSWGV